MMHSYKGMEELSDTEMSWKTFKQRFEDVVNTGVQHVECTH